MSDSIFSTYKTGENRVTASVLAVLRSLSLSRIERLLGALMEQPEFELLRFQNQPARGAAGVPDAMISASFRLFIETKIKHNCVDKDQLVRHLTRLDTATESAKYVLVLTPDDRKPAACEAINDRRLVWASFAALHQAIDELLKDPMEVVSEREAFLLRQLQAMLLAERLVGSNKEVVVVPARDAWPEYQKYHAYVCQPSRAFQPVGRIAFYTDGQIFPLVPVILKTCDSVAFECGKGGETGNLMDRMIQDGVREQGRSYKVMLLSAPDDHRTTRLEHPIPNNLQSATGRPSAFTQNQRYVSLRSLKSARTTSDLVSPESAEEPS